MSSSEQTGYQYLTDGRSPSALMMADPFLKGNGLNKTRQEEGNIFKSVFSPHFQPRAFKKRPEMMLSRV
jgi:hypothetical protein